MGAMGAMGGMGGMMMPGMMGGMGAMGSMMMPGLGGLGDVSSFPNAKPGDWQCQACGDHVFARNSNCRKCGAPRPEGAGLPVGAGCGSGGLFGARAGMMGGGGGGKGGGLGGGMQPGDWACPACGDHQFARNSKCRKCGCPKPEAERTGRERSRSPIKQRMGTAILAAGGTLPTNVTTTSGRQVVAPSWAQ